MSKSNRPGTSRPGPATDLELGILSRLSQASRDLVTFQPRPEHRRARANFWSNWELAGGNTLPDAQNSPENRSGEPGRGAGQGDVNLAMALRYGGDSRISQWWDLPGFRDWFTNSEEFRQRVEYIAQLALDELEGVLTDPAARSGDKLTAAKMALEVGGKFPGRKGDSSEGKYADEHIAAMSRAELETYVSRQIAKLTPTPNQGLQSPTSPDTLADSGNPDSD